MGHGPSSSHTMGPMRAAQMFLERNRGAVRFNVTLYGSLAATGKGHMTDAAILEVLQPVAKTNITWEPKTFLPFHPNGKLFESYKERGEELDTWAGGGAAGGGRRQRGGHPIECPAPLRPARGVLRHPLRDDLREFERPNHVR